nr:unnamed protein product [Callosobruchus chinensis]
MLRRFVALEAEIAQFLEEDKRVFEELQSYEWRADLYFLADIMGHINELKNLYRGKKIWCLRCTTQLRRFASSLAFFTINY